MGNYDIAGNAKPDRESALDYVMNKFEDRKKTEARYGREAVLTDLVVNENVTVTQGTESRSFAAHLGYDLISNGKRVVETNPGYVQGKECKTRREAIESLDDAIVAKSKKLRVRLERGDKYCVQEDVQKKTFVAYCFCDNVFASEKERKEAELKDFNRILDENSREVDGWPEWKRGGV